MEKDSKTQIPEYIPFAIKYSLKQRIEKYKKQKEQ